VERSEYPGSYGSHPGAANCTSVLFELVYMEKFYQLHLQSAASTASLEGIPVYPLKWLYSV